MKIAVAGLGYVGLSNAAVLAQHHEVVAVDLDPGRVDLVERRLSPFVDEELSRFLTTRDLDLRATVDAESAYADADYVVIATPTDYDPLTIGFDTSSVESVIETVVSVSRDAVPVVKSTVPVGFCRSMSEAHGRSVVFSPEFLREGKALHDNLYPSRIVVGDPTPQARAFADFLLQGAVRQDTPVVAVSSSQAEAIKLFSNTYLAMRVAFFNELDTFAIEHGMTSAPVIEGVCMEPRIGTGYNNPSFGYGGYCLPKDTRQLLANYRQVPQRLVEAIVHSNETRQDFIVTKVLAREPGVVGIYRLVMKTGSDNYRSSSIFGIIDRLRDAGKDLVIYEPLIEGDEYDGWPVVNDPQKFFDTADIILANRRAPELADVEHKVYTRDIFGADT